MCIAPLHMPERHASHIAQQLRRLASTIHICILQVMTWERPGNETMQLLSPVAMHALWHSLGHLSAKGFLEFIDSQLQVIAQLAHWILIVCSVIPLSALYIMPRVMKCRYHRVGRLYM